MQHELNNHSKFPYYIQTTHLRNAINNILWRLNNPEHSTLVDLMQDELEFENTHRYGPILENFIEKNETAKRLGYKRTLEEIGLMCDFINSNVEFERKDLDFFDYNPFDFYFEFLKSID
ncbi:MAG: hypothetical protein WC584_03560 [Candidatus Pacearchaeota archaeon]